MPPKPKRPLFVSPELKAALKPSEPDIEHDGDEQKQKRRRPNDVKPKTVAKVEIEHDDRPPSPPPIIVDRGELLRQLMGNDEDRTPTPPPTKEELRAEAHAYHEDQRRLKQENDELMARTHGKFMYKLPYYDTDSGSESDDDGKKKP